MTARSDWQIDSRRDPEAVEGFVVEEVDVVGKRLEMLLRSAAVAVAVTA